MSDPAAFLTATIESNSASETVLEATLAVSGKEPFVMSVAPAVSALGELSQRPHTPVCSLLFVHLLCRKLYLGAEDSKIAYEWAFY